MVKQKPQKNPIYTADQISSKVFKEIKEKMYLLNSTTELVTLPVMQNFLEILININGHKGPFESFFYSDEDADTFKNNFIKSAVNYLLTTKTFTEAQCLQMSNEIILQAVIFGAKHLQETNKHCLTLL